MLCARKMERMATDDVLHGRTLREMTDVHCQLSSLRSELRSLQAVVDHKYCGGGGSPALPTEVPPPHRRFLLAPVRTSTHSGLQRDDLKYALGAHLLRLCERNAAHQLKPNQLLAEISPGEDGFRDGIFRVSAELFIADDGSGGDPPRR